MPAITLKSNDGKTFETDVDVIKCSGTIQTLLSHCDMMDEDDSVIPLPTVDSATLERILKWAEHHKTDPELTEDDLRKLKASKTIPEWDAEFVKISMDALYSLLVAANYLDIKALTHFTAFAIALKMKGKSTQQLRAEFDLPNDYDETEKEMIRAENEWFQNV